MTSKLFLYIRASKSLFDARFLYSVFLFFITTNVSASVVLKINISDCVNCTVILSEIKKSKEIEQCQMVFPKQFERDNKDIVSKYALDDWKNLTILYNDSTFDALNSLTESDATEMFIFNSKNTIIFQADLKKLNLGAMKFFAQYDAEQVFDIPEINDVNFEAIKMFGTMAICKDFFNRVYIVNLKTKKVHIIEVNDSLIERMYKLYYGKEYKTQYPVMKKLMQDAPSWKPSITTNNFVMQRNGKLLILYNVRYYSYAGGSDTIVSVRSMIGEYDVESSTMETLYLPKADNVIANSDSTVTIFLTEFLSKPYLLCGNESSINFKSTFYPILLDKARNEYFTKGQPIIAYPNNYYADKSIFMGRYLTSTSTSAVAYWYSDSLYNMLSKEMVKIPYIGSRERIKQFAALGNTYDFVQNHYHILYILNEEHFYHHLKFDTDGTVLTDTRLGNDDIELYARPVDFIHPNQLVYFNKKNGRLCTLDL